MWAGTDTSAIIITTTPERLAGIQAERPHIQDHDLTTPRTAVHGPASEDDPCWSFEQDWKHLNWEYDVPVLKRRFGVDLRLVSEDKAPTGYWFTFEITYNGRHHDDHNPAAPTPEENASR